MAATGQDVLLLGDAPARAAEKWGRRAALLFGRRAYSFEDLHRGTNVVAATLRGLGIGGGDRVAIYMENRPEYLASYFGVPAAGAVLVPLNTFLSADELRTMMEDCGAAALITSSASLGRIAPALDRLAGLRHVIVCADAKGDPLSGIPDRARVTRFAPFEQSAPPATPASDLVAGARREAESTAVIIYTSGTTGVPKGVMLSHRNLLANAEGCIRAVGVTSRDRIIVFLPMFHSFTEQVGMLAPMLCGMSIALCERLDRAEVKRTIARRRPSIFPAVPAVFAAMAHARIGRIARWLNPVRLYVSGGAPLSGETLRLFQQRYRRPLCEGYGLSEAAPVVSFNPPRGQRKPGSVGRPLEGVSVRVVDDAGQVLPPGSTGILEVSGPNVMQGYLGREAETAAALREGWLHTGDLARLDEDGFLFIVGRSKDMLISRGMNVYPREIEEVLESHPEVREAAVVGVEDASRGEVPHAFVVLQTGAVARESDLRRLCLDRLARYKVPRAITLVAELPRNAAGKIEKEALKRRAQRQPSG